MKRTYVLVHGAWHGGWVWRDVTPALREMGHTVSTPTLTGVGERKHLLTPEVGLDTHVEDIVAHIEMEDLHDIVLVGWSSGGMVVSDVLARIPERIASMVYFDAFLPERGKPQVDYVEPAAIDALKEYIAKEEAVPPIIPMAVFGVHDQATLDFVTPRLTPHPFRAFTQPSSALAERPATIPHTYIRCTSFNNPSFDAFLSQAEAEPVFDTAIIESGHHAMLTAPERSIEILANVA